MIAKKILPLPLKYYELEIEKVLTYARENFLS